MKIVILDAATVGRDADFSGFSTLGDVTRYDATTTEEEAAARIRDAQAVIVNKAPLTAAVLRGAERLRFIGVLATGYDNCDIGYCRTHGIRVTNVAGYSTAMVAQHTAALALALSQKLIHYDRYVKSGQYAADGKFTNFDEPFCELDGKTWGIVGYGAIGRRVARIAEALGCHVITHSLTGRTYGGTVRQVDRDTLLSESDILSLHCPLTDLSRGFIDAAALEKMKRTAILINVARGPVVHTRDLYEALQAGTIAAAGLDVLDKEPIRPDNPLSQIQDSSKLIITPHHAWASVEARRRCVEGVRQNLEAFLRGEERNVIC